MQNVSPTYTGILVMVMSWNWLSSVVTGQLFFLARDYSIELNATQDFKTDYTVSACHSVPSTLASHVCLYRDSLYSWRIFPLGHLSTWLVDYLGKKTLVSIWKFTDCKVHTIYQASGEIFPYEILSKSRSHYNQHCSLRLPQARIWTCTSTWQNKNCFSLFRWNKITWYREICKGLLECVFTENYRMGIKLFLRWCNVFYR